MLAGLLCLCFSGCEPDPVAFDAQAIIGKWVCGTEYYRYDNNAQGVTWDTADEVYESEGQPFTWSIAGDQLTVVHQMVLGGRIPKAYTLITLNETTLCYRDNYNQTFTFNRVNP